MSSSVATVTYAIQELGEHGSGYLATPSGPGPHPAVLVLHDVYGLSDDLSRITARFARAGHVAFAPDHQGPGARVGCVVRAAVAVRTGHGPPFVRLHAAREWLVSRDDVDPTRTGVVGFCMGGGFAVLFAARAPVASVATFYGDVPRDASALAGIPPCVGGYGLRDRVFGPFGERLRGHLDQLGVAHDVVDYPTAGHSYMNRHVGVLATLGRHSPMRAEYDREAAEDSWDRMLAFLAQHRSA